MATAYQEKMYREKLPWQQVLSLSSANFSQAVMLTTPFTIGVFMVRDFRAARHGGREEEVDEQVVGRLTGLLAGIFSFSSFLTAYAWGCASNYIGRKPVIIIGNAVSFVSILWFGLSGSYGTALAARAFGGFLNGILGSWKCMIGESTDVLLQGKFFGYMSLAWGLGCIAGPALGGAFSRPCSRLPHLPLCEEGQLLRARPYFLACTVGSLTILAALLLSVFLLEETLSPSLRERGLLAAMRKRRERRRQRARRRWLKHRQQPGAQPDTDSEYESESDLVSRCSDTGFEAGKDTRGPRRKLLLKCGGGCSAAVDSGGLRGGVKAWRWQWWRQRVQPQEGAVAVRDVEFCETASLVAIGTHRHIITATSDSNSDSDSVGIGVRDPPGRQSRLMAEPTHPPGPQPPANSLHVSGPTATAADILSCGDGGGGGGGGDDDTNGETHHHRQQLYRYHQHLDRNHGHHRHRVADADADADSDSDVSRTPPQLRLQAVLRLASRTYIGINPFARKSSGRRSEPCCSETAGESPLYRPAATSAPAALTATAPRATEDATAATVAAGSAGAVEMQGGCSRGGGGGSRRSSCCGGDRGARGARHVDSPTAARRSHGGPCGPGGAPGDLTPADDPTAVNCHPVVPQPPPQSLQPLQPPQPPVADAADSLLTAACPTSASRQLQSQCQVSEEPGLTHDGMCLRRNAPLSTSPETEVASCPGRAVAGSGGGGGTEPCERPRGSQTGDGGSGRGNGGVGCSLAALPEDHESLLQGVAARLRTGDEGGGGGDGNGRLVPPVPSKQSIRPDEPPEGGDDAPVGYPENGEQQKGHQQQQQQVVVVAVEEQDGPKRLLPWYRYPQVLLTVLGYGATALIFCAIDELFPIFASAPRSSGGLGLREEQIAPPLMFFGAVLMPYSLYGYPPLQRHVGTLRLTRVGLLASVVACLMIPLVADLWTASVAFAQVFLYLAMVVKAFAQCSAFTGSIIAVNAAPAPEQLGPVNGVGQTLAALVRGVGPALGGLLWAVSLGLHSPGQQFLTFGLIAAVAAANYWLYGFVRLPNMR
ncbi:hypothetical protein VOLCADRAFT_103803 [Volvox carteri f. nagariensis]|uniref:Major facilitator superfamily (MFS) profile domain-containing protein n=1 Tax=Volvox carteri f. nagariensis TaxID=3068 RepID=D8TPA7_VOLCA|nr:uncharacterized protein VOLCADRAFT_103803 [Volvox carteri f. nagariensis]EFJ50590.1 hypothetical protein VOLCADRAFT_103803 [Volvox carteri f. nagariensis]|eukprot:XP_002948183.1 hypothetical protein VOLCADRAFT_103803 [Volvox carteri f. nagariensis]